MVRVTYVRQREALGLGHSVLQAKDSVGAERLRSCLAMDIVDAEVRPCSS